jgi:hypothetical protein
MATMLFLEHADDPKVDVLPVITICWSMAQSA